MKIISHTWNIADSKILNFIRNKINQKAKKKILKLIPDLDEFINKSKSTGGQYSDYLENYIGILKFKPRYVLECGSGISSYIIASALKHNFINHGVQGKLISMENLKEYYDEINSIIPNDLRDYIEFKLSEKVLKHYFLFRGVGYKEIPEYDYDYVFIDGPEQHYENERLFSFDLISAVKISNSKINGLIDNRMGAAYVYQQIFGGEIIKYNKYYKLSYIVNLSKDKLIKGNYQKKNIILKNNRLEIAT